MGNMRGDGSGSVAALRERKVGQDGEREERHELLREHSSCFISLRLRPKSHDE